MRDNQSTKDGKGAVDGEVAVCGNSIPDRLVNNLVKSQKLPHLSGPPSTLILAFTMLPITFLCGAISKPTLILRTVRKSVGNNFPCHSPRHLVPLEYFNTQNTYSYVWMSNNPFKVFILEMVIGQRPRGK